MRRYTMAALSAAVLVAVFGIMMAITTDKAKEKEQRMAEQRKLVVVWTSGDPEVAIKMVFMYVTNAGKKDWFDQVNFVIWGPSAKLAAQNEEIQKGLAKMREHGIKLQACKACTDSYGVSEKLEEMGVEVIFMGGPLTDMLKEGWHSMTF